MKYFFISLLLLVLTACSASFYVDERQQYWGSDYHKSLAYFYKNGNKTSKIAWCGNQNSLSEAKQCAIRKCNNKHPGGWCITGYENDENVLARSFAEMKQQMKRNEMLFLQEQQKKYILAKKNLCKSYGFKSENAIASCVQREIERERLAIAQRNANITRQNAQRQENINRALSETAKTIQNIGTPNSNVTVCNFRCSFSGLIVQGACTDVTVKVGSDTCFRTN